MVLDNLGLPREARTAGPELFGQLKAAWNALLSTETYLQE
jgi:hypothetical protein